MTDATKANEKMVSKYDAGSDYLKCLDFLVDGQFKAFSMVIKEFIAANTLKAADGKVIKHPVIGFEKTDKRMILNSTNQEVLHLVSGTADGNKTIGIKVMIEARVVPGFGEECLGLRLMPPAGTLMRRGIKKHLGKKAEWHGQELPSKEESQ